MAQRYFGTDGIRGQVNTGHMTVGTVYKLARAASKVFCSHSGASRSVLIGKDTRQSCDMFEAALIAGLNSVGVKCFIIGVAPTPAVALLTTVVKADFGIMISASHNSYTDNGIKLFDATGHKLEEKLESKIEGLMDDISQIALSNSDQIGTVERSNTLLQVYKSALLNSVPQNISLDKLKIVLDCAHGAAFQIAPAILKSLNASLVIIGAEPDGLNINNKIGSTHTEKLKQTVLQHKADIGIALDGDADRCILVDETGQEIDGDQLIALIATQWRAESKL